MTTSARGHKGAHARPPKKGTFRLSHICDSQYSPSPSFSNFGLKDVAWGSTALFLIVGYFSPLKFSLKVYAFWLFVLVALSAPAILKLVRNRALDVKKFIYPALLCFMSLAFFLFNGYGAGYAIKVTCFVFGIYLLLELFGTKVPRWVENAFFYCATLGLAITLVIYVSNPEAFAYFGGVNKANDLAPLIYGALDKNRTALVVFIYFAYSLKNKRVLGILIGLGYPLAYFGRQYVMMLACFLVVLIILRILKPKVEDKCISFIQKPYIVFALFFLATLATILLTFYWVNYVIPLGVVEYKQGLNDGSNAMRMSSNAHVINIMLQDPTFLVRGFDDSIFNALGINQQNYSKSATYYVDGLYRLVQPHNDVINMLVREGLLFTLVYYLSISQIVGKTVKNRYEVALLLSFLLGSMFLHLMFTCQTLVLFVFVMACESKPLPHAFSKTKPKHQKH